MPVQCDTSTRMPRHYVPPAFCFLLTFLWCFTWPLIPRYAHHIKACANSHVWPLSNMTLPFGYILVQHASCKDSLPCFHLPKCICDSWCKIRLHPLPHANCDRYQLSCADMFTQQLEAYSLPYITTETFSAAFQSTALEIAMHVFVRRESTTHPRPC